MYPRILENQIVPHIASGKALIIHGPRQVGKTTLARKLVEAQGKYLYLNCDEPDVRTALTERNSSQLKGIIGHHEFVVIDEAQRVPNIGVTLKIIIDNKLTGQLLATGSSSWDSRDRAAMRNIFDDFTVEVFSELLSALSPAGGADPAALIGEGDKN